MNTKDYIKIFEQSSELLVVIDTDFTVIAASDAYLNVTKTIRENITGQNFFEVFPDNPDDITADGESKIRASLNRVIKNKTTDTIAVIKYDIPKPEAEGGGFELKYWQPCHSPVLDEFKNVKFIVQRIKDVTENETLIAELDAEQKALKQIVDSEKRYSMMLMQSPFGFAVFKGKSMVISLANDSIKEFWAKGKDIEGKPLFEVISELKDSEFPGLLDKVYTTGIPFYGDELLAPILRNGKQEDAYYNFVYQPYLEADETISGVTVIAYEVTAQVIVKKAVEAQREAEKKALKLVEETNKRYYSMLMESPFAFSVMKGKDMVVTLANDLIKEFWGKGNEVEGKTLLQVLPELKDQPFPAMIDSVYTTGIPVYANEILARLQHKDKMKERYFNVVYQPDHEADGTISGVITIAYEVTEMVLARKKIEESEQRFQGAIVAVRGILWTNNPKGEMVGEQRGWASLTGQSYEEYQGFGWAKAIHPDDAQPTVDAWNEAVSEGKNFIFEHRIRLKNGNWGNFSIRAIPSLNPEGLIQEWIGVHTDITKQRQTEKALKNAIHEQKEAKSKAEAAKLAAEEAMQAKQQFLSNMSNEIRTPMNSIIGFTNVVLKTELNKKQKEYISAIKISGDALLVLINDILDLAKVDAGKMTFEQIPFNLFASISDMLHVFDNKIQEKNLELVTEYGLAIPEVLEGDPMRLRQIILNLVSNAVKFTAKGKITLGIRMLKEEKEKVTIEFALTDTGIGIPENKLIYIFEDFGQVAYEDSKLLGGTGLGLAIVKQLVERQGGTVKVKSKINEGSTFSFILIFKKTTATTILTTATTYGAELARLIKNTKVLIVEDMPLNQLLMKTILIDFGFQFDIADNGKIAIEKLQQNNYDIILMDLQMPEMNGFEATEYIRNKMNSQIPIIALTADVTSVDVEKAKTIGMNDYISKPIDEKLLYSKIIKYLKKHD